MYNTLNISSLVFEILYLFLQNLIIAHSKCTFYLTNLQLQCVKSHISIYYNLAPTGDTSQPMKAESFRARRLCTLALVLSLALSPATCEIRQGTPTLPRAYDRCERTSELVERILS